MPLNVHPIAAYQDNYIWCVHNQHECVLVDPGDAAPVLAFCQTRQLQLKAILITHHHWDHTNGINELLAAFPDTPIYGPYNPEIESISNRVKQNDTVEIASLGLNFEVLEVPGHTLDHIAYYSKLGLFCGDTLFSAGCGRLFEGTPAQMYQSLSSLSQLPDHTPVYCTHEYTLANIEFALTVEPQNQQLIEYKQWALEQRALNTPTLPTTICREKSINPFLRCEEASVKLSAQIHSGTEIKSPSAVFASLRRWKDQF